jgi:hypothetical protein
MGSSGSSGSSGRSGRSGIPVGRGIRVRVEGRRIVVM